MKPARALERSFLKGMALLFVVAAVVHLAHILSPVAGDASGPVRHAVFVAINLVVAAGLWRRPQALLIVFGALVVQQVLSHGAAAYAAWAEHHEVDLASLGIVVMLPLTWAVLWRRAPHEAYE